MILLYSLLISALMHVNFAALKSIEIVVADYKSVQRFALAFAHIQPHGYGVVPLFWPSSHANRVHHKPP